MDNRTQAQGDPQVTEFMVADPPTLIRTDSVIMAARMLIDSGLPGLPVLEDGRLVGLLTETNLIAQEAQVETPSSLGILDALFSIDIGRHFDDEMREVLATTVDGLMTTHVTTVLPEATLTEVATVMADRHVNPVPVVDRDGRLIGIVSRRDVVRIIAALDERAE